MHSWSLEMARQSGWDLWVIVCAAAALVLLSYAVVGRIWAGRRFVTAGLCAVGIGGTLVVIVLPVLHRAGVGLVWTFAMLAILSATFYLNLREQLGWPRTAGLLGMRVAALALLVPMLFEPVLRFVTRPAPERPLLFLVDTSGSMSVGDVRNGPTRLQSVWRALRPELGTINEHFVPRYFTFDTDVRPLQRPDDLATAQAEGKGTDIVNAVGRTLAQSTRPDAAIVLLTDGIDNATPNPVEAVRASARPIHTVRVGSELAQPTDVLNVAVDDVRAPDDFAVNHASTVTATVRSTGLGGRVVDVKLAEVDASGKPIGEMTAQKLVLQSTAEAQAVQLSYKPTTVGLHSVAVWIDPVAGERTTADNRQVFQGLAIDPRIKVLYVEGSVRLEYKWTRQAFLSDANIELATYLRKTNTSVETGGTVDGQPFRGLPTNPDGWKRFDVIVIGDVDASYFTANQLRQVEQRIGNGGGLLMLGGQSSFAPGGYGGTPIETVLPVQAGDRANAQDKVRFVPQLTAEGTTHPILDGLTDWFATGGKPALKALPPLNGNVIVGKAKAGAQVLMVHADLQGGQPETVLAVQRYGQGRSVAFTVDTTYLWFLPLRGMGQDSPYNKLWGQMVRWLAGQDVRDRQRGAGMEALISKSTYQLGENVRVRALVRDERGDATRYAQVKLTLSDGSASPPRVLSLPASSTQAGLYELVLPNPSKGMYTADLLATKDGKELGRQRLAFAVVPPADEMTKVAANPQLLVAIADETHGYHYDLGQLPALIDQLVRDDPKSAEPQQRVVPLDSVVRVVAAVTGHDPGWSAQYDLPSQGLVVFGLLIAEWALRRRWQLA